MGFTQKLPPLQFKMVPLTMLLSKNYWNFLSEAKAAAINGEKRDVSSTKWLNLKVYIHSFAVLIIHGFHIWKFTYLLKATCHNKINTWVVFVVICGHRVMKNLLRGAHVPSWGLTRWCSLFLSQLSHCKQESFSWFIQCHIFHILCFLLLVLLFKRASKHSAEVLAILCS